MDIFEHPGNLGAARGTLFSIHHGDWPAYPQGEDFYTPLLQLTAFPPGTEFVVLDDIDHSLLLVADVEGRKLDDPYDDRHFHVAIWHEDLRELHDKGMIDGIEQVDESRDFVISSNCRPRITDMGRRALLTKLRKEWTALDENLGNRVAHLFRLNYYDIAIREACVQLEDQIKIYLGSQLWGNRLVEEFILKVRAEGRILESYLRTSRQELRTVFKFIRNDFAHNLRQADEAAAYAMLFRIARARSILEIAVT